MDNEKRKNIYCRLYIVRHVETEWNVKKLFQGHSDSPLTTKGIGQAKNLHDKLSEINFSAVYSSDMLRTKRTAEIIMIDKKIAVQTTKALRERCFGPFEGKGPKAETYDQFINMIKDQKQLLEYAQLHPEYKTVETDEQIMGRYITFLREISVAYASKKVLVVSSGGIMRVFLTHIGWGTKEELPSRCVQNMAITQIDCDGVDFFVRKVEGVNKRIALP